ncbi:MAG TPA: hypothetical protein VLQ80_26470 [Candidatus Saccharimonadia bacterium]|nr:hypothetical protein [Candidatus Saccharimonadia bacterium]
MDFVAVVDQVITLLRQRGRVTYRTLQRQFPLDEEALADLLAELRYAYRDEILEEEQGMLWVGDARSSLPTSAVPAAQTAPAPRTYTPAYLAEQILTSRSALEGERKQVTVLFADLKGSMELLAERDPEEARQLLDPVLEHMMTAVHHYEGTVNQVMGDGQGHSVFGKELYDRFQEAIKGVFEAGLYLPGIPHVPTPLANGGAS